MFNFITRRTFVQASAGVAMGVGGGLLLSGCEEERKSRAAPVGTTLSLQFPWASDAEFIGYFVAIENGYYTREGLSVDYKPGNPEKLAIERLAAGGIDIALTNIDGTVAAITEQGATFKIIGTQYQRSPLGIVSLAESGIRKPSDLIGRTLAAPKANIPTIEAFFRANHIKKSEVRFLDYQYDPTMLVKGIVDATVDFVTNVPYWIRLQNKIPTSFLLADFNFSQFMDTVVVTDKTLAGKRKELIKFLRASRQGWNENFKDVAAYPPKFSQTYFKDNGRTVDNEKFFNLKQKPLIEARAGIFSMTDEAIEENISSLRAVGLKASRDMFATDLLAEVK